MVLDLEPTLPCIAIRRRDLTPDPRQGVLDVEPPLHLVCRQMTTFKIVAFIVGGALVALAGLASSSHAQTKPENLPSDVTEFVGRRAACVEWSQKAFDPELTTQLDNIMTIMRSLRCEAITDDESLLRQRYASEPVVLAALKPTWVKVVKRLPVQIPPPANSDR